MKRLRLLILFALLWASPLPAKSPVLRQFWAATQTSPRDVEYGDRYFPEEVIARSIQIMVRNSDEPILHEDFISLTRLLYQQEEHFLLYRSYRLPENALARPSTLELNIDGQSFALSIGGGRYGCEAHACYYGIWLWLPRPIVEALAQAKTSLSLELIAIEQATREPEARFNASPPEVAIIAHEVSQILHNQPLPATSNPTIILERQP